MSNETAVMKMGNRGLQLTNMDDMLKFATAISVSGLAPKDMQKPETIMVAIQMGAEIGLTPMASLQNIAVINGRPTVWGDAALALVRASGQLEAYSETEVGTPGQDDRGYKVTAKRKGMEETSQVFAVADAKRAGLWGKQGPWTQYPQRMLKLRARSWALRDNFGDVLKGMQITEEARDITSEVTVIQPTAKGAKGLLEKLQKADKVEVPSEPEIVASSPVSTPVAVSQEQSKADVLLEIDSLEAALPLKNVNKARKEANIDINVEYHDQPLDILVSYRNELRGKV